MDERILQEYQDQDVLVTGGAGCIGGNLVQALLALGANKVIVVDDLSAAPRWNVPDHPSVVFIRGSILEDSCLTKAFSEEPEFVFHLAAHFANQNSVDHPGQDLMVNGLGTLKVLQFAQRLGARRLVYASSGCSVYGNEAPLPLTEDFVSLHLDTPYQIHKLLGELYCNFFADFYDLPITIMRYFNVYGPGELPGRYRNVIPNFLWRALHGMPLPITGTGQETRDFTFVEDIVRGTLLAGLTPAAIGEAINIATGTETKIVDLAGTVNEITGNESGVAYARRRDWDKIIRRRASTDKARKVLSYEPTKTMLDGLKDTLGWFLENNDRIEGAVGPPTDTAAGIQ